MPLKRRSKPTAEFNLSSLTDIIFLLLIFFMLTSSAVQIQIDLPESISRNLASPQLIVILDKNGNYTVNGAAVPAAEVDKAVARQLLNLKPEERKSAALTIAAEKGVRWHKVSALMELANKLGLKAVLGTQPVK